MNVLLLAVALLVCEISPLVTSQPELSCSAKPNPGNCKAYRPMWYFDAELGYCRGFVYGGCGGNKNTYPNCRACMSRCTNYNPHLMCQYLEFEFFKKFIAGKLIVAPPAVTTLTGFPQGQPMRNCGTADTGANGGTSDTCDTANTGDRVRTGVEGCCTIRCEVSIAR
ncbi:hypothetical protein HPB52_016703 [Rhipicephalus sanguineus]|uniref:BPTI/Kunitz inhibitor domain-containing protein n=1 Tax=Rhipicephalus sanguineus TaxID=34632 RepID=A0A9D4QBH7_RHISA|nr:hypothetical protein HPB52_016703 [Rhipicephalus sanguineus]